MGGAVGDDPRSAGPPAPSQQRQAHCQLEKTELPEPAGPEMAGAETPLQLVGHFLAVIREGCPPHAGHSQELSAVF